MKFGNKYCPECGKQTITTEKCDDGTLFVAADCESCTEYWDGVNNETHTCINCRCRFYVSVNLADDDGFITMEPEDA